MKEKESKQNSGYGLFSLTAMVIGIIIGSGIFVKNSVLFGSNTSVILSMLSWLVGGIIILAMILSFLEIFSITEITNEQSTIGNWSKHLLGKRTGRILGYYYTMIYEPLSIVVIAMFGSNEFMKALGMQEFNYLPKLIWTIGITFLFLIMLFTMNAFFTKPGKIFQNIGTGVKIIPLSFVIILFIGMMIFNFGDLNPIFSPEYNKGMDKGAGGSINLLLISIPPVLFSFDGFLSAGSLSKDTNKKTTFRNAVIIGMIFVAIIYFLFSISTFALGDVTKSDYGSIQNVIYNKFPNNSFWLAPIISIIITFSITTAVSGTIIGTSALMTDLSATNSIKDVDGNFLKRNKHYSTPNSTISIALLSIFWFEVVNIMNIIFILTLSPNEVVNDVIPISDFASDIITVGAFGSYTIVIFGGVLNRFTNKVEVKKQKGFLVYSIFTMIVMAIVTIYFAYKIFIPTNGIDSMYILKLVFTFIFIISFIVAVVINIKKCETLTKEEIEYKEKMKEEYFFIEQE